MHVPAVLPGDAQVVLLANTVHLRPPGHATTLGISISSRQHQAVPSGCKQETACAAESSTRGSGPNPAPQI